MTDCLVRDARLVTPRGVESASIAVDDGLIAAVGDDAGADRAFDTVIEAEGMIALPGALDVHTHMHDDALFPDGIDIGSETASAAAGGVTTVVELPTQTPVTTPDAMADKIEVCDELAHVDFGFVAGNFEDGPTDISGLMDMGVPDFKTFTAAPYQASDRAIIDLMEAVGDAGGTVRVHCENQAIMDHARNQIEGSDPAVYPDSRPLEAELEAISRVGWLATYADCPVHIVHITSGTGARIGAQFQRRADVPVTLETCPQYLVFSKDDAANHGPFLKANPSLKSATERERLWEAVRDGTIDIVGTDHFPTYREERKSGWDDIWDPYAGLPGVETMLEVLISEGVHTGRISWPRLLELVCAGPARKAGLYPRKGTLREGTDADIALVCETDYQLRATDLAFVGGWTPYEGRRASARVDTVIAGGEVVARDHEVLADPGDGSFLARGQRVGSV